MTINLIVFVAALSVLVISILLVFHPEYEDGLIGRFALALIGLAAFARVVGILQHGFYYDMSPPGTTLWLGIFLFMSRHLYRFLRWRYQGVYEWRRARK